MSASEPTAPKLTVDDVLALDEAGLVQYMKQNCGCDGNFNLPIEGWEKLTKDERDKLGEKLRNGALRASAELQSRPVDLAQVTDRLFQISDPDTPTQAPSRALPQRSPTREPSPSADDWIEVQCHNDLVDDGGWPAYPVSLLAQIRQNPAEYREILQPWQQYLDTTTPDWDVFRVQLDAWQAFRKWQKENRKIYDIDSEYHAFRQETRRQWVMYGFADDMIKKLDTDPLYRKGAWNVMEHNRLVELWHLRENHGSGGFSEYVEEMKRRLENHGFTRTFQLEQDPRQQDKLTTWIEYLNYEYSWHDRYTRDMERRQSQYDEAWQKLVDSGVLRPSETGDDLRDIQSKFRLMSEENAAEEAVESAKSAAHEVLVATQNEPQCSTLTEAVRIQMLATALSRLEKAQAVLEAVQRRGECISDFVKETSRYKKAQRNSQCKAIRLQWIVQQVPRIELELNESQATESNPDAERGPKQRPGRDQDDQVTPDRKSTKRKRSAQSLSPDGRAGSVTQATRRSGVNHSDDTVDDERPSKQCKIDDQDSDSELQASGRGDAASFRDQAPRVPAARQQNDDGNVALETSRASSHSPLPSIELESQPKAAERSLEGQMERERGLEHGQDEIMQRQSTNRTQELTTPDGSGYDDSTLGRL